MEEKLDKVITKGDLDAVLSVLQEEDAKDLLVLKDELVDNWKKRQIYRTETEMRISVLNEAKHPTNAAKYWQSVREMGGLFDILIVESFSMRRNKIRRLRLEEKMRKAIEKGDKLKQMEIQVDLDENAVKLAHTEQSVKDRLRELKLWSKIKEELNDGTFDTQDVNSHQVKSLKLYFENRAKTIGPHADTSEIMNAFGPLTSANRLIKDDKLLSYSEIKPQLKEGNSQE